MFVQYNQAKDDNTIIDCEDDELVRHEEVLCFITAQSKSNAVIPIKSRVEDIKLLCRSELCRSEFGLLKMIIRMAERFAGTGEQRLSIKVYHTMDTDNSPPEF
ncbi:uncharacterized protein Bfra_000518 [Botrytis fragariae]|uniref:Uncharacterized protein n=1 Tax=Botrytis fragariae TaxID=1964551 RepID=A0A8H6B3I9_9HELO|nr:uncharacterized protein Bfra_000518 [Botrytis fragariae]KAF5878352.1 hypothetical protein Bfra_000518 [Botrytis fragariae]